MYSPEEVLHQIRLPSIQNAAVHLLGDENAPRVPEVYHYFSPEHKMAYLVMDILMPKPPPVRNAPEKVAVALQWLLGLSAPDDVSIGLMGGGWARHEIFRDHRASLPFSGVEALQRYMNRALERIQPIYRPKEIDFIDKRLVFTQSDMHESNFFFDTNNNMCMVNFELVGVLPLSFASYTLHSGKNTFAREVAKYLDWLPTSNLYEFCGQQAIQLLAWTRMAALKLDVRFYVMLETMCQWFVIMSTYSLR